MGPEILVQHVSGSTLAGREQRFAKPRVVIGRHPDCDIAFDTHRDLSVSSRHAELYTVGDELFVKDLNSRNGTYINTNRVTEPVRLQPDDVLNLGYDGPALRANFSPARSEKVMVPSKVRPVGQSTLNRVVSDVVGRQQNRQSIAVILFIGILAFGLGAFTGYLGLPKLLDNDKEDTTTSAEAPVILTPTVSAFGRLEPDGGIVNVSGIPGETVDKLLVEEGDVVTDKQELAYLRGKTIAEVELAHAEAALADAQKQADSAASYGDAVTKEARYAIAQTGIPVDLEIKAIEDQILVLKNNLDLAEKDTKRLVDLGDKAPAEQLARQRLVEKGARLELEATQSKLDSLKALTPIRRDQAKAQVATAQANQGRLETSVALESARKNIERVKAKLDLSIIRAPRGGRVLKILTREATAIGSAPLLQLADTAKMYVTTEVFETDLRRIKPGQKAILVSSALPDELHGEVEKVLWTVTRDAMQSLDPTAPSDLRVIPVKILLDPAEVARHRELLTRLINLQIEVYIEVGEET